MAHERFSAGGFIPVWVKHEHFARYDFAAQFVKDKIVVDCACGSGAGTARFAEAGTKEIFALDASVDSIDAAARANANGRVHFSVGDALATQLPDALADVFISLETIEHIDADKKFLAEVLRVLKADGIFICSTPNREIVNPGRALAAKPWNSFHVREYSTREFAALLGAHFEQVELFGQNPQFQALAAILGALGKVLPAHGAVRLNQCLKLPRLLYDTQARHRVRPAADGKLFEYAVAVCRGPRLKTLPLDGQK